MSAINYRAQQPKPYELCGRCGCLRPPAALMPWQDGVKVCAEEGDCTKTAELLRGSPVTEGDQR